MCHSLSVIKTVNLNSVPQHSLNPNAFTPMKCLEYSDIDWGIASSEFPEELETLSHPFFFIFNNTAIMTGEVTLIVQSRYQKYRLKINELKQITVKPSTSSTSSCY